MGRPAFFRGNTPGDLDTEGRMPPPSRVRPRNAETSTYPVKIDKLGPQKEWVWLLTCSSLTKTKTGTARHTQTQTRQTSAQERLAGAGRVEAARPKYPPPALSSRSVGNLAHQNRRTAIASDYLEEPQTITFWFLSAWGSAGFHDGSHHAWFKINGSFCNGLVDPHPWPGSSING